MLVNISLPNALKIWSELEAAYYGKNGYGGYTAEIYASTITPLSGLALETSKRIAAHRVAEEILEEEVTDRGKTMQVLLKEFQRLHPDCRIRVNGMAVGKAFKLGFVHRCHVEIRSKETR